MADAGFTLIIGDKNLSSWSLRPWFAFQVAGIPVREVLVRLDRPDTAEQIARHSPSGFVPALHHEGRIIWDSLAILEYLHDLFPEKGLWPEDLAARAHARSVSAEMHAGFAALRRTMPMRFAETVPDHAMDPQARRDIDRIIAVWEETRARHGGAGPFLFGARPTIADAMYAPVVSRLRTYGVALSGPAQAYAQAVWDLPAMQLWLEGARADLG